MLSSCQLVLKNSAGSPDEAQSCSCVCSSSELPATCYSAANCLLFIPKISGYALRAHS